MMTSLVNGPAASTTAMATFALGRHRNCGQTATATAANAQVAIAMAISPGWP